MTLWNTHRNWVWMFGVAIMLSTWISDAVAQEKVTVRQITGTHAGRLVVPINKSQVVEVDQVFKRVTVGNPEIADVLPLSDRTIYVLGKQVGLTNMAIFVADDRPIAVVDINVAYDVEGLKAQLNDLFPRETIQVWPSANALVLSGTVSGEETMAQILTLAGQYSSGRVSNMLSVSGSQQVMLHIRFAEIQRSLAREFSFSFDVFSDGFAFDSRIFGPSPFAETLSTVALGGFTNFAGTSLDIFVDALETKGLLKILAEPTLVTLSGDEASFLAGGEFPVPVAQGGDADGAISVQFKDFGVSLTFQPTVIDGDLINLVVSTEVSAVDDANAVAIVSGSDAVPGLVTRRANTTVELHDGQSFAIAGLLQNNFSDTVSQLPWIGDVPVIGSLLRSSQFQRDETELVIITTVYLVKPVRPDQLTTPADGHVEPSDLDLFFWGRIDGGVRQPASAGGAAAGPMLSAQPDGGVAGAYGHIIQ